MCSNAIIQLSQWNIFAYVWWLIWSHSRGVRNMFDLNLFVIVHTKWQVFQSPSLRIEFTVWIDMVWFDLVIVMRISKECSQCQWNMYKNVNRLIRLKCAPLSNSTVSITFLFLLLFFQLLVSHHFERSYNWWHRHSRHFNCLTDLRLLSFLFCILYFWCFFFFLFFSFIWC